MIVDMRKINGVFIDSFAPGCAPNLFNYTIANSPPYTLIASSELEQLRAENAQLKQRVAELEERIASFEQACMEARWHE